MRNHCYLFRFFNKLKYFSLSFFLIIGIINFSKCKKSNPDLPRFKATIIGFDPCTALSTDLTKKGLVLKIETLSINVNSTIIDTVTTYNLPSIFVIPPEVFLNYQINYLFPLQYRNKYKFKFSYETTPDLEKTYPPCTGDINLGNFIHDIKGK
ncbi:hypothetical protein SAMN05444410_108160 [Hydrobacter penzbergensis]|uniref:Uncharacterized protein n=1 Tax=Hydrobacter penzbergensis TaxID=1235997 RepID=A0A8X8ID60_9BACT|nr:hypothetical protein SAMN05444410_108160 [Hydrobacter penzbergensis]